jgi:5-methylcytosine-specific restriction enzyme A
MTPTAKDPSFWVKTSAEAIGLEKEKARALRKSQWWKRKLAKGECYYCKARVAPADLTMDHIVPVIRGGQSTRGNVAPACKACNSRKKYLLPIEWQEYLERLTSSASSEGAVDLSAGEEKTHDGMPGV